MRNNMHRIITPLAVGVAVLLAGSLDRCAFADDFQKSIQAKEWVRRKATSVAASDLAGY